MTCESSWGGDVYRAMLVEGLSELLSELRYLLLSDGPYGGDMRAESQVHGERGVSRCVRSHDCTARWYASTKRPQS